MTMNQDKTVTFMDEVSAALAEIVEAMQARNTSSDEISSALTDIVAAMEAPKAPDSSAKIAEAINGINFPTPKVSVNVSPTPINVNAPVTVNPTPITVAPAEIRVIERATPSDYKLSVKYDTQHRITEAIISRIKK